MTSKKEFEIHFQQHINRLNSVLSNLNLQSLFDCIEILESARKNNKRIFFIGNGGSAATSSHFVNDLCHGTGQLSPPYNAISLCDNSSILTALANDYSYDDVFKLQLVNLAKKGDVLVCISASGNSKNIILAVKYAKTLKMKVVGISAFDGGQLAKSSDCSIRVKTDIGDYGVSEDIHMMLDHILTSFIKLYCD